MADKAKEAESEAQESQEAQDQDLSPLEAFLEFQPHPARTGPHKALRNHYADRTEPG